MNLGKEMTGDQNSEFRYQRSDRCILKRQDDNESEEKQEKKRKTTEQEVQHNMKQQERLSDCSF